MREQEILQELDKLAVQAAALANDPKGKKPPPLKPGQKSPQQLLQEQLQEIRTPPLNGWVVVGYPNTLEQASTFISMLSNFQQPAFEVESNVQLLSHTASSIVKFPKQSQEDTLAKKQPLVECGIDAMISLLGSTSESIRRSQGRMLDPATGIVYHMEDNPPPANVQSDKLVPFQYGEGGINHQPEAISKSYQKWNQEFKSFEMYMRQFGISQRFAALYVENGGTGVETKIEMVRERIDGIIVGLLQVKKEILQEEKQKLKEIMIAEEAERKMEEQNDKNDPTAVPVQGQDKESQADNVEQNEEVRAQYKKAEQENNRKQALKQENYKKMISKYLTFYSDIEHLFQQWNKISLKYISLTKKQLSSLSTHQLAIIKGMTTLQQRFASYLSRSDQKQIMMDQFIQNYQHIIASHQNFFIEESTIQGILAMVQKLGDDLWDIIEKRKTQAEDERYRIMSAGWVKKQLSKLLSIYHKLAGIEYLKARGIVFILVHS